MPWTPHRKKQDGGCNFTAAQRNIIPVGKKDISSEVQASSSAHLRVLVKPGHMFVCIWVTDRRNEYLTGLDQFGSNPGEQLENRINFLWVVGGGDYKDKKWRLGVGEDEINKIYYNLTLQVPYSLLAEIHWSWFYVPSFKK